MSGNLGRLISGGLIVLALGRMAGLPAGLESQTATTTTTTTTTTTIVVDAFEDDTLENGNCTLREAVLAANRDAAVDACPAGSGKDVLLLAEGTYYLTTGGADEDDGLLGDLDITDDVAIVGLGQDRTAINGGSLDRVLHVLGAAVELEGLAVQKGWLISGGGGGIYNQGVLTLTHSLVWDNRADQMGGGIHNAGELTILESSVEGNRVLDPGDGGGIYNAGLLVLSRGAVLNNSAYGSGGVYSTGVLTITNATVSGNRAAFGGGVRSFGVTRLENVTVSANEAVEAGSAGGIEGSATIRNSIVALNPGGNCLGTITSAGYNLDSEDSCNFSAPGDLTDVDPRLSSLYDHGGAAYTHMLLPGSPAVDAGSCLDNAGQPVLTDQRGVTRPQGLGCDIGAFEGEALSVYLPVMAQAPPPVDLVVTSRGESFGYPSYWWVRGYILNNAVTPVYSVTVGIDVTIYPYCEPGEPCDPYQTTESARTAFPATLPGQVNPFSWSLLLGKASASVGAVTVLSGSPIPGGPVYYPLTVVEWRREGQAVAGSVRNDSGVNLVGARVVIFSNACAWQEAALTETALAPGQQTGFNLEIYYCSEEDVTVIGQGRSGP